MVMKKDVWDIGFCYVFCKYIKRVFIFCKDYEYLLWLYFIRVLLLVICVLIFDYSKKNNDVSVRKVFLNNLLI